MRFPKLSLSIKVFLILFAIDVVLILFNQWRKTVLIGAVAAILLIMLGVWGGELLRAFVARREKPQP